MNTVMSYEIKTKALIEFTIADTVFSISKIHKSEIHNEDFYAAMSYDPKYSTINTEKHFNTNHAQFIAPLDEIIEKILDYKYKLDRKIIERDMNEKQNVEFTKAIINSKSAKRF